jgi:hypothetical protein
MTQPTFTARYPILLACINAKLARNETYPKRAIDQFFNCKDDIYGAMSKGEIIAADSKYLREKINEFVKTAFDMCLWDVFTFGGKWQALPVDLQHLDHVYEARLLGAFKKKLEKVTSKDHMFYTVASNLTDELMELRDVVEYLKTIEVKASDVKARTKAAKQAADEARNANDPVDQAVLPLKKMAMDRAEEGFREAVREAMIRAEAKGFDLEKIAPYPEPYERTAHQVASLERAYYLSICDFVGNKGMRIVMSPAKVEEEVAKARKMAAAQFEAYAAKLNVKIGDKVHTAVLAGNPWFGSHLTVVTENKGTQVWHTQMILNVSKLGKLFNQFPTRLKK